MSCCPQNNYTGLSATTSIQYTDALKAIYGPVPRISLFYRDENMNYVAAGVFTQVQFDGNMVYVDHGGVNRWWVKIH